VKIAVLVAVFVACHDNGAHCQKIAGEKRGILLLLSIMSPVLSRALDSEAMTDLEPDFDVLLLNLSLSLLLL
jgi:hypothetical protein